MLADATEPDRAPQPNFRTAFMLSITTSGRLKDISPDVIYSDGGFFAADEAVVSLLKARAAEVPRKRCRLCFHAGPDSAQHDMLIVMHRSSYVRPHRHFGKAETLTIIEGECDAVLFDPSGQVTECIPMSPAAQGGAFFYRMPEAQFHTLIFKSEWLVFLETTIGPFDRANSESANWAPPESELIAGHAFLAQLALPAH